MDEGVASADAKVDEFGAKDEKARVGIDDGDSNARLDEIIAKLDEINGKRATATVDIQSSGGFGFPGGGLGGRSAAASSAAARCCQPSPAPSPARALQRARSAWLSRACRRR